MDEETQNTNNETNANENTNINENTNVNANANVNTNANVNANNQNVNAQSGNWLSRQPTVVKVILALVAICCIGVIILLALGMIIPGGFNWQFDAVSFPQETTIGNSKFYLPSGFSKVESDTSSPTMKSYSYSNGVNYITISVYTLSYDQLVNNLKSSPRTSNFGTATFNGVTGTTLDYYGSNGAERAFVFEKNGYGYLIEMDSGLNFNEYMPKILG